jgi:hypothetical protein
MGRVGHPKLFLPKKIGLTPCTSKKVRGAAPNFVDHSGNIFWGNPDFFRGFGEKIFIIILLLPVVSHSYNVAKQVKDSVHIPKAALAIKKICQ